VTDDLAQDPSGRSAGADLSDEIAAHLALGESRERLEAVVDESSKFQATTKFLDSLTNRMLWTCAIENAAGSYGTGILVAKDLVLTNHHVIGRLLAAPAKASDARCRFDFWEGTERRPASPGRAVELAAVWWLKFSEASDADISGADTGFGNSLDYALIRLAEAVGDQPVGSEPNASPRGWLTLPITARMPDRGEPIIILQHPSRKRPRGPFERQPSKLTIGRVRDIIDDGRRIRHDASTLPGSSGSACFDRDLNIVGLHHAGDPDYEDLARWNQAIPIKLIVEELKQIENEAFVGVAPKLVVATRTEPNSRISQAQRMSDELANKYTTAAKILLDRQQPEESVLISKGVVHVMVCRAEDQYARFLERLEHLTLPCRSANDRSESRIKYLIDGAGRNGWVKEFIEWPKSDHDLPKAIDLLRYRLNNIKTPANVLLETVATLKDIDADREPSLVSAFAEMCAALKPPDQIKAFVVYQYEPGWFGGGSRTAARFAALWGADRPAAVGDPLLLSDIAADDLGSWRNYLRRAWEMDETEILSDIRP
jgi:hypothetical protein